MGLDNGILIRAKNKKGAKFLEDNFKKADWMLPVEYEINYMRKNWGIRNDIIHNYFGGADIEEDDYFIDIDANKIEDLVQIFAYYLDEKHWEDEADSIWDWHIGIREIANTIFYLRLIEEFVKCGEISGADIEMYFYDSY